MANHLKSVKVKVKKVCTNTVRKGHWKDIQNQRLFMDKISKELNFNDLNDWYSITVRKLKQLNGGTLLSVYL